MKNWLTTARITGLFYVGLLISSIFGYLIPISKLYAPGDSGATLSNIINNQETAHIGLLGELGIVAFQVLVALWFYKLFRQVNVFAAGSLLVFGLLGGVSILVSLIFSAEAVHIALTSVKVFYNQAEIVQLMWELHQQAWIVGHLFFGLWLIPMGQLVIQSKMPRILGWILIVGGVGYILSCIAKLGFPQAPESLVEGLTIAASIGEVWIIGYLLRGRGAIEKLKTDSA